MELSFTELDTVDNKQGNQSNQSNKINKINQINQSNYKNNTYYNELLSKSSIQQKTTYNNDDYNNIVVVKKPQYNQSQTLNQPQKQQQQQQRPVINTNKNLDNKPKKKQVSYDDILSSMNTVVIDGKLEFIKKDVLQNIVAKQQLRQPKQPQPQSQSQSRRPQQYQQYQQYQQQVQQKKVTFNQPPPTQLDKSSYIYNKYFKDYKDPSQNISEEPPRRPLTKNELIKQLIINKANAINERNRIAEIKSTKLLFNNNNNRNIVINSRYIPPNPSGIGLNHLFGFK